MKLVRDILQHDVSDRYNCSESFTERVIRLANCKGLPLGGLRLIDFRNGHSIHSWEIGLKGDCSKDEVDLMNALVAHRRRKEFGEEQDGKSLSRDQIRTFFSHPSLDELLSRLIGMRYLSEKDQRINLVSGNMSFEVFKLLDQDSVSITLVSSDAHKIGIHQNGRIRRITPRECARLQGYPDEFHLHPDDNWAYHQLGNSVSVPVIERVINDLFDCNKITEVARETISSSVETTATSPTPIVE